MIIDFQINDENLLTEKEEIYSSCYQQIKIFHIFFLHLQIQSNLLTVMTQLDQMQSPQYCFSPVDTKGLTTQQPVCYCEFFGHKGKTIMSECHQIEYLTERIRYFNDAKFINNIYSIDSFIRYEYLTDKGRWRTIFQCQTMFVKQLTTLMKLTIYAHFNDQGEFVIDDKHMFSGEPKMTLVQIMRKHRLLPKQQLIG